MQNLSIKLQIDDETNEAVLYKSTVYDKITDKNGNEELKGVTVILVQTDGTPFKVGRVIQNTRLASISIYTLKETEIKRVLRWMLADESYVDDADKVLEAHDKGISIDLKENTGYLFLQEFEIPLIPFLRNNTRDFFISINASLKRHGANTNFRYYFENVIRYGIRNAFRGRDVILQKTLMQLNDPETLLFDFANVTKLAPATQQAIAIEVHKVFFENKNSKLKRADYGDDFCRIGKNFIFRCNFFTNDKDVIESTEDIFVEHDNQISLDDFKNVTRNSNNEVSFIDYDWSNNKFLTIPISLMQSMPLEWQIQMDTLLREIDLIDIEED